MKIKCKCGNKNANDFKTRAYIAGPDCSEDEPGTVYINIECEDCGKICNITNLTNFDSTIIFNDDYGDVVNFSRHY